ncbi:MAG TPA: hypothetical protein VHE60_16040 [Pyrinomonadaceae bacterium]|nr:hypothetical protein [Pyrinomonadaceae bacterium]
MLTEQVCSFPCPRCNELINTGMDKCSYCSAPIDPAEAEAAAGIQDQVNRAYSDASFNRNMAVGMWVFFLIRFIPLVGIVGWVGMLALLVLVPIKLVVWQVRFGRIKTADPDHKRARMNRNVAFLIWIPLPLLFVFAILVLANSF